jgi:phosphatidylinositol-3-phosphatase
VKPATMSWTRLLAAAAVVLLGVVFGLAGSPVASSVVRSTRSPCSGQAHPSRGKWRVIFVMLENHTYSEIAGSSPYLNLLARTCALAADYSAITHPSLPNYLALTSGGTHGITSDCTDCSTRARSIFGQVGDDWREYLESMPSPGYQGASAGLYAKKHNPASYYTRIADAYARNAVPLGSRTAGTLARDLRRGTLRRFSLVVPNLCHDEHSCSIATGDRWLHSWLPLVFRSRSYRLGKTVLVLTYDEGVDTDNQVYTVVAAPWIRPGTQLARPFDHYSLLRTAEDLLGLPCLAHACSATSMLGGLLRGTR